MPVALVDDATPSPLERVLIAADTGNGVSQRLDVRKFTFVNPDLIVTSFRPAEGEWIGLRLAPTSTLLASESLSLRVGLVRVARLCFRFRLWLAVATRPVCHRCVGSEKMRDPVVELDG